jgi:ornithine cyclodeaminase/alanine dehydrogenase-like protein (mu-crystallin family)
LNLTRIRLLAAGSGRGKSKGLSHLKPLCSPSLAEVVAGQVSGRDPDTKWTLFLSGGTGIEDTAVTTRLYKLAREKGVGTEFEFNQPY